MRHTKRLAAAVFLSLFSLAAYTVTLPCLAESEASSLSSVGAADTNSGTQSDGGGVSRDSSAWGQNNNQESNYASNGNPVHNDDYHYDKSFKGDQNYHRITPRPHRSGPDWGNGGFWGRQNNENNTPQSTKEENVEVGTHANTRSSSSGAQVQTYQWSQ